MKLKKWLTGVLAAAMALSLAACSDGGAESADAGSEDSITLGFAQVGSESEWRTANTDNIKVAAEAAGVTLQFSDAQQKQENQIKAIRSFIASDVDVISLLPHRGDRLGYGPAGGQGRQDPGGPGGPRRDCGPLCM